MIKRSWIEVKIDLIERNYKIYKEHIPASQEIMAVVKADAYGHGEREIAERLQLCGCKNYAVSNIEEAIHLRDAGITGQVLILGYTPISYVSDLLTYNITQAILSEDYAKMLSDKGVKAQFAIDTGMNRIGLDADNPDECASTIRKYYSEFVLTGIFTHLSAADCKSEDEFTASQINKFRAVAERLEDLNLPYIHCMNSAGGLWQDKYGNMIRLGIILYGLKPDYYNKLPEGIKPALEWKSVISMVKKVSKGETIGYGRSYRAEKEMTVATIPTGYADGYSRMLSNKGIVVIKGKKAPIVGRICMDQFMVDITNIPEAQFEDEVILLGDEYNADDMAKDIGTIGYEVICDIGKRVPRVYIR